MNCTPFLLDFIVSYPLAAVLLEKFQETLMHRELIPFYIQQEFHIAMMKMKPGFREKIFKHKIVLFTKTAIPW